MASQTPDFGLNYFGPGVPGSLTDDGGKFTLDDRILISRVLAALATHTHSGGDRLGDPSGPPGVALDPLSGQLPGGLNVYYRVSYVDRFGLESAASPEVVQATPTPLDPPAEPVLAAAELGDLTGPGLSADTYSYALTAISGTNETPLGPEATLTLAGDLPTVVVTFPDVQDTQDSWGVWRMASHDVGWTRVATVAVADADFTDDYSVPANDCACDPGQAPPTDNLTASSNLITVSVPDPTLVSAEPSQVVKWRLYRTFTSGSYPANSLVAEVTTTANEDGTGGLVTTLDDDGSVSLLRGAPLEVSQTLAPPSLYVIPSGTVLPPVTAMPEGAPFALDNGDGTHTLMGLFGGAWEALGGGGGGGAAAVGVGDFAIWQRFNKPRDATSHTFDYAGDLSDHQGTSILPSDDDPGWIENWGSAAPKLAKGLYCVTFSADMGGLGSAAWKASFDFLDGTGTSIAQSDARGFGWSPEPTVYGYDWKGDGTWSGGGSMTTWVPEGTHFDFDWFNLLGGAINATLMIRKVG